MRISLRAKILLFTVPPLIALGVAAIWIVNRTISTEVHQNIEDELKRASTLFEDLLATRSGHLAVNGMVIVQDPRFFSVLTLPGSPRDPEFRATVAGVANAFNSITETDLFEVFDSRGRSITKTGHEEWAERALAPFISSALAGSQRAGLLAGSEHNYQVAATPVVAGGRVVGVLLLGDQVGSELAEGLKRTTRSEVTFLTGKVITASTLEHPQERDSILEALRASDPKVATEGMLSEIRGRDHVYVTLIRQLPQSDPTTPQFYALQRSLDVETAFLRSMQSRLVELGALAAFMALLAGLLISERITSPVRRLVRGAEEMERGNYDFPIDVADKDEIGYLASRFQEMRQRLRAYVTSLEEVARLKTEFISVASHELRTPMSVIRGYHELFAGDMLGPVTAPQREALEAIGKSVTMLNRIADNATRFAQIEGDRLDLRPATQPLAGLIRRSIERAQAEAKGREVQVIARSADEDLLVRVDPARFTEALTNLVTNGIRFTPDGGSVEIKSRIEGQNLVIDVADTGIGIPEEKQKDLFGRPLMLRNSQNHHSSTTLEFNSAGLGLGLSIAQGIVQRHGGTIEVRSVEGSGSVFTIRLPMADVAERRAA
ncbi:MAG TPA: HAMP domain-containing sensor histidine kinase [Candidatus Dormibacteraeota bacterium]|nr:HAMP domain-containing sensor histidine kinase [Candidatus Dormibacteraeota bacterium]